MGVTPCTRVDTAAAVFDLDGTLVLSERRNRMVWEAFFGDHGIELDEALFRHVTGRRWQDSLAELPHLISGRTTEELQAHIAECEGRVPWIDPDPVPGAAELVASVAATGSPVALVTSADRAYAEGILANLGVRHCFHTVVSAENVTRGKPDPDGYLTACRWLGVDPARAVGFEDAPAGVAAVKAAGMYCVGVATVVPAAQLTAADVVVTDLAETSWPLRSRGSRGPVAGRGEPE